MPGTPVATGAVRVPGPYGPHAPLDQPYLDVTDAVGDAERADRSPRGGGDHIEERVGGVNRVRQLLENGAMPTVLRVTATTVACPW
ncbi:hypothetical protein [Streptomyces sp. NBC_00400]|uniref:hypothetical protein n=1 Tax=Streptomyces sp. NBC_00400 TaxID=2975737 RepID=UPI003FA7ED43